VRRFAGRAGWQVAFGYADDRFYTNPRSSISS
jgi:hypothetical protein